MQIKEITNKSQWEKFVCSSAKSTFLQSWNWGEFNKNTGEKIWRLGVFNGEELLAVVLIIKVDARRGSFLFVPQGPIIRVSSIQYPVSSILNELFAFLKDLGKKEKVGFVRISPILENNEENLDIFKRAGFRNAPIHMMHPETTWVLDIAKSEDEIFRGMRKTHRNLIRRAAKEGVEVKQSTDEKCLEVFYDIHMETVKRHKFVPFSYSYIKNEIDAFKNDNQIGIFSARYRGKKIISSAIIVFYGDQAFYHHGASSSKYNKIPSSYLVLWEAIKEARRRGKKVFNFYGIVDDPAHPWAGLSRFKKGFGGYKREFLHCQDLPLSKKYIITYLVEKARRIKRGY
jgi:lipid II:glycine glycyltransferase (peptidoglycan interpeptide bridge formation enzyme)